MAAARLLKDKQQFLNGLVAQLNRAPDSGSDGRGFESRPAHLQFLKLFILRNAASVIDPVFRFLIHFLRIDI